MIYLGLNKEDMCFCLGERERKREEGREKEKARG